MKKYKKPVMKTVELGDELLQQAGILPSAQNQQGNAQSRGFWYSKQAGIVTDDEYLGGDVSYSKGIFRGSEEISEDATIVNHY